MVDDGDGRGAAEADPMAAEFDTVAGWTADVAAALGPEYHEPAGCRGSGDPSWLDWLIDRLAISGGDTMIDVGAGVGGPSGYAARRTGVRPVLSDPEPGACSAAARLFDATVVQADAAAMPFGDGCFDVAWCLGVLCTAPDSGVQLAILRELRRLVGAAGRIGLLVLVATRPPLDDPPEGNTFPTEQGLAELIERAGLEVTAATGTGELPPPPPDWAARTDAVEEELGRRYGQTAQWREAQEQSERLGRLLAGGRLSTRLLTLRVSPG